MANLYYTSPTDVTAGAKVRSTDLNTVDAAIDAAFDKLPTETNIKQGKVNYAVDTGAADAYVVSLPHAPASYADGLHVRFKPTNTNTGASTINVNSLGVKSIKKINGDALSAGDLTANGTVDIYYNSTTGFFYLSSAASAGASATAAAASATAAASSASAAATSATNAASSATTATTQASNASTSATNAASSATTATTKASEAATSATNAATSATNAATSATNAATSATNAASSATAAAASAAAAVNSAAYVDTDPIVKGSADATKRLRIEVDGLPTATDRVWTAQDANITVAGTNLQQTFTKPQRPSLSSETAPSSNTVTWDLTTDSVFRINLSANITTFNLTGTLASLAGYQYQAIVRYNGGTTISWNASFEFTADVAPTLTGTSGKVDVFNFVVASADGTNFKLLCTGYSQNLG